MNTYFPSIGEVCYEGPSSRNPFAYRYYNEEEKIGSKSMAEHLRFSMGWWHTLTVPGLERRLGAGSSMEIAKRRLDAAFECMRKLHIRWFCMHDQDAVAEDVTLEELFEVNQRYQNYLRQKMKETGIRPLWTTANTVTHPCYGGGSGTAASLQAYLRAAAQIRGALDAAIDLGSEGFMFWGGREGYENQWDTDMSLELANRGQLIRMAIDYARRKGFQGKFYVEVKPAQPGRYQYFYDVATTRTLLHEMRLDKEVLLTLDAYHAAMSGRTLAQEIHDACKEKALGTLDVNQNRYALDYEWETVPAYLEEVTLCMYELLRGGGFTCGGITFDAKERTDFYEFEEVALNHIRAMDTFALGLRSAALLLTEGKLQTVRKKRYQSFEGDLGRSIREQTATLESLTECTLADAPCTMLDDSQARVQQIVHDAIEACR